MSAQSQLEYGHEQTKQGGHSSATGLHYQAPFRAQESRHAVAMDLRYSQQHDILTDKGFANMAFQILNLKPGSGHFTAPVCSTWVFMFL